MGSSWALPGEDPVYEDALDFDFWDNCRSRGMPSSMMPYRYNGGFKIWQAPGVVVFDLEMIHDARVISTDGRPPLASAHKQHGRVARALGGQHARRRDDQLQGRPADDQPRRRRVAGRETVSRSATR